jgi:DHA2 family multidrug resistance protein-like MFS transporter
MVSTTAAAVPDDYHGTDKLIFGIVLAVITFWLFAQTTLNVAPTMRDELRISESLTNIAVSISALFSGIFIVVAGSLADRLGRVKLTYVGLALGILGSLLIALSPSNTAIFLITGRIIQGLSAACIMPATLALMKAYFDGKERQRALSFWSIGSWGGSGVSALFGGLVASSLGWRWIFWISIIVAVVSFLLATVIFFKVESGNPNGFVDLSLFNNKTYTGATLSNFLLNGAAGTLLVALALVQQGAGLSSLQSGLLTIGYLVAILSTIRVGEKLLQKMGARKPMLMGCAITATGILLTTFTFLLAGQYMIVAFIGFTLFGIGLGFYATPSTDAALSNVPDDKAGAASGIYKMASSLGAAFGVAISAALFTALSERDTSFIVMSDLFLGRTDNVAIRSAAAVALLFNVLMVVIAIIAIIMTVPKEDGRRSVSG